MFAQNVHCTKIQCRLLNGSICNSKTRWAVATGLLKFFTLSVNMQCTTFIFQFLPLTVMVMVKHSVSVPGTCQRTCVQTEELTAKIIEKLQFPLKNSCGFCAVIRFPNYSKRQDSSCLVITYKWKRLQYFFIRELSACFFGEKQSDGYNSYRAEISQTHRDTFRKYIIATKTIILDTSIVLQSKTNVLG